MNLRLLAIFCTVLMLSACTHKSDDSAAVSKAKTDTNVAVEATKGAIRSSADAAKAEAEALAAKAKAAAAEAKASPEIQRVRAETSAAVEVTKQKAIEIAGRTKELAAASADKTSN